MTSDQINALFECVSGLLAILNITEILKSRRIQGIHWAPTLVFVSWGFWNLYYYPHLGQWFSLLGCILLVSVNTLWLLLIVYYSLIKSGKDVS